MAQLTDDEINQMLREPGGDEDETLDRLEQYANEGILQGDGSCGEIVLSLIKIIKRLRE